MKKFDVYREEAGLKDFLEKNPKAPEIEYVYYAYKNGQAKAFNRLEDAKAFSKNYEKNPTKESKEARDLYWAKFRELEGQASSLWYADLRKEYSDLNTNQFDIIYSKAYDDGHASGYDCVFEEFENLYSFFIDLKNAS